MITHRSAFVTVCANVRIAYDLHFCTTSGELHLNVRRPPHRFSWCVSVCDNSHPTAIVFMCLIVWEVNLISYLSSEYVDWSWVSWKSELIEFTTSNNRFSRLWCSFRTIPPIVCFWNRVPPVDTF